MPKYDVVGVSDWPEDNGAEFDIFKGKDFLDKAAATAAARVEYSDDLKVIVRKACL
jgi:hypothetical protein|tara:strand:- start:130 stop:297 length:168 start_codon:yes stop_codon:yes gene_type:complete